MKLIVLIATHAANVSRCKMIDETWGRDLRRHNIDYYFFNTFYEYEELEEPKSKIDLWGRDTEQLGLIYKIEMDNMYDYLNKNGGTFHERKHPTKESHEMWANYIIKRWL